MNLVLPRRNFLLGGLAAIAAPSIVRAASLMPISSTFLPLAPTFAPFSPPTNGIVITSEDVFTIEWTKDGFWHVI